MPLEQRTIELNNERIMQFQLQLADEIWESVCIDNDTNNKFNSILHTFLNNFEASFPVKYESIHRNKNGWITQGIKICYEHERLCAHARACTHTHSMDSYDAIIKAFYIKYCKILNTFIQEAKKQHYNRLNSQMW
jgi:hypothetical protein